MIGQILGGLGLFVLGMVLATEGLRTVAGSALRRLLLRYTGGPLKAMLSGAVITTLVQSSGATTLATIGFVGAGLISFQQSIGVIFGANLGTTTTGWLVAAVGLKVNIAHLALPLIGVGALVRLFARGRAAHLGLAVAGFGLIFLGIDTLQGGMQRVTDLVTPSTLPDDTVGGRLLLVGMGALLTALVHSSSAAVATTLTALSAGSITLDQAAAVVIGANIGSTVTAVMGAIGSTTAARRASLAHVLFNVVTGTLAFVGLPLLVQASRAITGDDGALALAAFHTGFNLIGVLVILPFLRPFTRLILALVKEPAHALTRFLDPGVASMGTIAVEAVRRTTVETAGHAAGALADVLELGASAATDDALEAAARAVEQTRMYLASLRVMEQLSDDEHNRHLSTLHALDHLGRLVDAARVAPQAGWEAAEAPQTLAVVLAGGLRAIERWAADPNLPAPAEALRAVAERLHAAYHDRRAELLTQTAQGSLDPLEAAHQLDALRWLELLGSEADRMTSHLEGDRILMPEPQPA